MHLAIKLSFQLILILSFLSSISALAADGETPQSRGIFKSAESVNLIKNPSFEEGSSYWMLGKYDGGKGKFQVDTTKKIMNGLVAVVVTANDIEGNPSNVQLFSTVRLEKNA